MDTFAVVNPATEEVIAHIPCTPVEEVDLAIERAAAAFPSWRAGHPADRARLLRRFADSSTTTSRNWPGWRSATPDTPSAMPAGRPATFATCCTLRRSARAVARSADSVAGGVDITFKRAAGVVAVIVPWNFPMPIAGWGFAPAWRPGNTVVLKPPNSPH